MLSGDYIQNVSIVGTCWTNEGIRYSVKMFVCALEHQSEPIVIQVDLIRYGRVAPLDLQK